MYDFSAVKAWPYAVHFAGSKYNDEGIKLTSEPLRLDAPVEELLLQYFLKPFKGNAFYNFFHVDDLDNHPIYQSAVEIFDNPDVFMEHSAKFAELLYQASIHPMIPGGELFVVYLKDVVVDSELVEAIGLFKSENKETYLKVYPQNEHFELGTDKGINISKLDKGCLIFNTEREQGFKVAIVDNVSKDNEALYWKQDFLQLKRREDDFYHTQQVIDVCKGFCDEVLEQEENLSTAKVMQFKEQAQEYFNHNERFDIQQFGEEVVVEPKLMEAFEEYAGNLEEVGALPEAAFEINNSAVQSEQKFFKSVLKLDKRFHLYVHGGNDYMERGYDETRQMNYYKLFYEKEA